MNQQIEWMARNHVASTLLMLCFAVGGLILAFAVKQEVFPEIALDRVVISVSYPGASPEEVEEGIILKIEESISSIDGIKEIVATAAEGMASVSAVIDTGADDDLVLQDIKSEIDRITTFPLDAEKPVISKALIRNEVISVVVYGTATELARRQWAELIRDELLTLPGITQVELNGVRPYEISLEIPEEMLRRHNLTLDGVAAAVRQASRDIPGGTIKTRGGEVLLRTKERRYFGPEYSEIVIKAAADGTLLRLGDIAQVKDGFEDVDLISRFNGLPAAMVQVFRVGDQKPTEIADTVREYVARKAKSLPQVDTDGEESEPVLALGLWNDNTEVLRSRFQLLLKNAIIGLLLVFVILGLFLEIKLALWVMSALPVSFLGALFFMPAMDVSINMITLFAFIMALGIVVDNSVVVGESIHDERIRGKRRLQAAIEGTREVAVPVVFSVLTTVAAFLPLLYVTGTMGKFIRSIPVVVISILMVSLVVSLFCLPALLGRGRDGSSHGGNTPDDASHGGNSSADGSEESNINRKPSSSPMRPDLLVDRQLNRLIDGPYRRTLQWTLGHRALTVAIAVATLLIAGGFVGGGIIKFRFMPEVEGDIIMLNLEMPQGALVEETARIEEFISRQGLKAVAEFDRQREDGSTILRHLYSVVGGTLATGGPSGEGSRNGTHLANTILFLQPSEIRNLATSEVAGRWRELVGEIPGVRSLTITTNMVRFGANIDVQLSHADFDTLLMARDRLKEELSRYPGVSDIADSFPQGKRELKITLKPEARTLGITEQELGRQVRGAFFGSEALRLQRGRNEVKVMARYPEEQRRSIEDLESMMIRTAQGGEIPLLQAARVESGRGFAAINRSERKRVVNVTASVDGAQANAEEILATLRQGTLAQLLTDFPGLSYDLEGEEKERRDSMGSMMRGFVMALFAIYALLAIPLRNYLQPLIIMVAIPFGIVGALAGHGILGHNLSILSIFGIVALSGVVVNNSLLLIDRINRNREGGSEPREAVIEAGKRRFRPIMLTSLTTFFGLFPMILETSVQAQFLIPMAISLGFGVLFSTLVTLVLVPTLSLGR